MTNANSLGIWVVAALLLCAIFYVVSLLNTRIKGLKNLAQKYNFKYEYGDRGRFSGLYSTVTYRRNIITGNVNGHNVEFYDLCPSNYRYQSRIFDGGSFLKIDDHLVAGQGNAKLLNAEDIEKEISKIQ
ncbi:MAG: hypothetical protein V4438_01180 [Patescibacteria group bacterium]